MVLVIVEGVPRESSWPVIVKPLSVGNVTSPVLVPDISASSFTINDAPDIIVLNRILLIKPDDIVLAVRLIKTGDPVVETS